MAGIEESFLVFQYAEHQQWMRNQREYDRNSHQGMFYYEQSLQWVLQVSFVQLVLLIITLSRHF